MYCKNCGKPIDDDAKFCAYCGTGVQQRSQEVSAQSTEYNQQSRENWETQLKQRFGHPISGEYKVHKQFAPNGQPSYSSQNAYSSESNHPSHNQQGYAVQKESNDSESQEKSVTRRILSLIAKIPVAFLIWFTLTIFFSQVASVLLNSTENFLYIVLVLVVPVAAPFYLLSKKVEKKPFYQKGWVWAIFAVLAVMFASASGSIQEPDIDPTDVYISATESSAAYNETSNTDTVPPETTPPETVPPTSDPTATEDAYKESCEVIDYKTLCRYSDDYTGAHVRVTVKVQQILDAGGLFSSETAWRGLTDDSGYGLYLGDEYYLLDKRPEGAVKVLKDDVVVIYGEFVGMKSVTRALTLTQDEIPYIEVKYVEIVE